jgi:hypothetical protein
MTFATHYSRAVAALRDAKFTQATSWVLFVVLAVCGLNAAGEDSNPTNAPARRAAAIYQTAEQAHRINPANAEAAWQFARACFDWAEFATNNLQRAQIAGQGIRASRALIARSSNSAPGHYYLGMNLGQLARTMSLGALPIVDEMEVEFKAAHDLDEKLDFAGPDRNLGLLYLDAPSIVSIGSRSKARAHLRRAAGLAPDYPENRLNLIEASLRWRETDVARRELSALEGGLDKARAQFSGDAWTAAWADWERRLAKAKQRLQPVSRPATSPKNFLQ